MSTAFWIAVVSLAVPLYAYIGYPVLLFILAAIIQTCRDALYIFRRSDRRRRSLKRPFVSIILAAHNEEKVIRRTIDNLLKLDYPADRYEVIIGSDGSSDRTVEFARMAASDRIRVLDFQERRGKLAVITDCARRARGDVLVLSDANTLLKPDAVTLLLRHFDSAHVGVVCGELRLATPDGAQPHEGLYWRYEVILKMLESRLDSTLGANGALYAIRKSLFPALPPHLITDDFVIPMKARSKGFRIVYDPEAAAIEETPSGVADEFRRRIRIGAGNWQSLRQCADLLLPWKGFVAFAFWSHKVLRWLTPFLLPTAFIANCLLLPDRFWLVTFALQLLFYAAAAVGGLLRLLHLPAGPFHAPLYFLVINLALAIGMIRGILGLQGAAWRRTARAIPPTGEPAK